VSAAAVIREEDLVREAVSRIRRRIRTEGQGGKSPLLPRLGVKFCGGCNPEIDRGLVAGEIRKELAGEVLWVPGDEEADFLLIINGCRTACADTPETCSRRPTVVVSAESIDG
jgi:hypothetical protein